MSDPDKAALDQFVSAASRQIALPVPEEYRQHVLDDFGRIAAVAALLLEFPLEQGVEPAPVFVP